MALVPNGFFAPSSKALVTTSDALVTSSDALVTSSILHSSLRHTRLSGSPLWRDHLWRWKETRQTVSAWPRFVSPTHTLPQEWPVINASTPALNSRILPHSKQKKRTVSPGHSKKSYPWIWNAPARSARTKLNMKGSLTQSGPPNECLHFSQTKMRSVAPATRSYSACDFPGRTGAGHVKKM